MHGFTRHWHGLHHAHDGQRTAWLEAIGHGLHRPEVLAVLVALAVILGLMLLTIHLPAETGPMEAPYYAWPPYGPLM